MDGNVDEMNVKNKKMLLTKTLSLAKIVKLS